jgi:uncharacterized membrane protein
MKKLTQDELDEMRKDPSNYKLGLFYYNANDPRVILPKPVKWMGWTLNFAKPMSYVWIVGVLIALVGIRLWVVK